MKKNCCSVTVVESIPENLTYPQGSPSHLSTYDAWMKLISGATKTIDIVAFYWTMRSSDTGHVEPSAQQVNEMNCHCSVEFLSVIFRKSCHHRLVEKYRQFMPQCTVSIYLVIDLNDYIIASK